MSCYLLNKEVPSKGHCSSLITKIKVHIQLAVEKASLTIPSPQEHGWQQPAVPRAGGTNGVEWEAAHLKEAQSNTLLSAGVCQDLAWAEPQKPVVAAADTSWHVGSIRLAPLVWYPLEYQSPELTYPHRPSNATAPLPCIFLPSDSKYYFL